MATRHENQVVDDLDGAPIHDGEGKQITFFIGDRNYEIDLSRANADDFYSALEACSSLS